MTNQINQVANLIAQIDTGAANVFRNKIFHRETILNAFLKGCQGTRFEDVSFGIWSAGMEAVRLERLARG